jgi:hypothetical protein
MPPSEADAFRPERYELRTPPMKRSSSKRAAKKSPAKKGRIIKKGPKVAAATEKKRTAAKKEAKVHPEVQKAYENADAKLEAYEHAVEHMLIMEMKHGMIPAPKVAAG